MSSSPGETYPSRYWTTFPFLDQDIHFSAEESTGYGLFKSLIVLGSSLMGGFATLNTFNSPLADCTASISDFCFGEEACHAKPAIRDGSWETVKVCMMVNVGRSVAIKMDPLRYLIELSVYSNIHGLTRYIHQWLHTHPMAYVWQSAEGAKAVIESFMVQMDIWSDVDGSKRITSPLIFPTGQRISAYKVRTMQY